MKLGLNRKIGLDRFLTSWKSQDDLGTGDYLYKMNPSGSPQFFLYKGSTMYWRPGPWPWQTSSAATFSSGYKFNFVNNENEVSYDYFLDDTSIISRLVVDNSGLLSQFMWNDSDLRWKEPMVDNSEENKYFWVLVLGIRSVRDKGILGS
jgi:hypothetical protein